jgi:hypothetical protein
VRNNPLKYIDPTGEKVELVFRKLQDKYAAVVGAHSFLRITPEEDPEALGLSEGAVFTMGAYDNHDILDARLNDPSDINLTLGNTVATYDIPIPDGMSENEFIEGLLYSYALYDNDEGYNAFSFNENGRNCHNFTSTLLNMNKSSDVLKSINPKTIDPGLDESIDSVVARAKRLNGYLGTKRSLKFMNEYKKVVDEDKERKRKEKRKKKD